MPKIDFIVISVRLVSDELNPHPQDYYVNTSEWHDSIGAAHNRKENMQAVRQKNTSLGKMDSDEFGGRANLAQI
ncbi:MAG: hypothetical protein Q9P01_04810 [Anaerolineae bacterium]|nr:hypothetical protein [Anaerolineae bacterium]